MNFLPKVFLDANIIIMEGKKRFDSPKIELIRDLTKAGLLEVITTDLTVKEIAKHFTEHDFKAIKLISESKTQDLLKTYLDIKVEPINPETLYLNIFNKNLDEVSKFYQEIGTQPLLIDSVKPSLIFQSYCLATGFFAPDVKKNQFSDAFIFECVKANVLNNHLIIVSNDNDFTNSVAKEENIILLKSVEELLNELGVVSRNYDIQSIFKNNYDELIKFVDDETNAWGLNITNIEDAEVTDICVKDVELLHEKSFEFNKPSEHILVVGKMKVTADIDYSHPDWDNAMYDSEEKRRHVFGHVNGQTEISFHVDFSMAIELYKTDKPSKIEELSFSNTDDFNYIEIEDESHHYR